GRGHAEADGAVGNHVGVDVLLPADDRQREQEGEGIEADKQQEGGGGAELVDGGLLHLLAAILWRDAWRADKRKPPARAGPAGLGALAGRRAQPGAAAGRGML